MSPTTSLPGVTGGEAVVRSAVPDGSGGRLITVWATISPGLPRITVTGVPETCLREALDRVRAAILSSGMDWPRSSMTIAVNGAAPGSRPGPAADLAVAAAILAADGVIPAAAAAGTVFCAELALDGTLRPARGTTNAVTAVGAARGPRAVIVAAADHAEAARVPGVLAVPEASLAGAAGLLRPFRTWLEEWESTAPPLTVIRTDAPPAPGFPGEEHYLLRSTEPGPGVYEWYSLFRTPDGGEHAAAISSTGTGPQPYRAITPGSVLFRAITAAAAEHERGQEISR